MVSCKDSPHLFEAYSEYLYIHPNAKVHRIGDEISPRLGVMICAVIGNGIRWLRQVGGVSIGDAVAIVGPGQQGLAAVSVAKESGAGPIFVIGLEKDRRRLEMDLVVAKEIRVQGVYSHDSRAVRPAIKMARSGKYPFEELIAHTFPLSQAERAVRLVAGEIEAESPLKVVIDPKG
jgi:threonine dehydrogenase-like Zn-dependent dehydrogenase